MNGSVVSKDVSPWNAVGLTNQPSGIPSSPGLVGFSGANKGLILKSLSSLLTFRGLLAISSY